MRKFSQAEDQTRVYGAAREETITVSCRLDASPPVVAFSWRFNSSGDVVDLMVSRLTVSVLCCSTQSSRN
ncbi:hypothetical protein HAZT_HAZT009019 [Hyalella azteca]|uniref:Ig-like domain-containing protein n=1 Tax=Hyalella azteca TaxID=294128 RepID=A0A6A0HBP2_HYAAZ|nr:hypothetical protein HAZT_HAZT009019 [Hyalella azteca]